MITRQQIEQYTDLKREIIMLSDQIYNAENGGEFVVDMVRGSGDEIPYAMHNITIKGYTSQTVPRLQKRKTLLEKQCTAVELYIEGLPDSLLRQIITWRYVYGKSLAETARQVGYSESQTKRRIKKFFEKMTRNEPR